MGNTAATLNNSKLADAIDKIASNYILSQNFNDMNKLSEKNHCDKLVILTAKIINNKLNPLEQKEVVKRIEGEDKSKEAEVNKEPSKEPDINNKLNKEPSNEPSKEPSKEVKEEAQKAAVKEGGAEKEQEKEGLDCIKIAKYYVKIAHLYAAVMKTINPVIISSDENGKMKKYDLMNKQNMPSETDIKNIQHNNFCTTRINTLLQESDYNVSNPKNKVLTVNPRFCNMNYDSKTKKARKFYDDSSSSSSSSSSINKINDINNNNKQLGGEDDDDDDEEDEKKKSKKGKKKSKDS